MKMNKKLPIGRTIACVIASVAVAKASGSLRDMRVGEVKEFDVTIGDDGRVESYRVRLSVSFKFES